MNSLTKHFSLFLYILIVLSFFSSCCNIPLFDCGPKISKIKLMNDTIFLKENNDKKVIFFELFEYQRNNNINKYYQLYLNIVIDPQDTIDLSITKVSVIINNDTIFAEPPAIFKNEITKFNKKTIYNFGLKLNEDFNSILLEDIKIFDRERNKVASFNYDLQLTR